MLIRSVKALAVAIVFALAIPASAHAGATGWVSDPDNDVTVYRSSTANGHIDIRRASAALVLENGYYNAVFRIDVERVHAASTAGVQRFSAMYATGPGTPYEQHYMVRLNDAGGWRLYQRSAGTVGEWVATSCAKPSGNRLDLTYDVVHIKVHGRCANPTKIGKLSVSAEWLANGTSVYSRDVKGFGTRILT